MEKIGFIKTRERNKELIILQVDKNCVINSGFAPPKKAKKRELESNGEIDQPKSKRRISTERVYKPDAYFRLILEGTNADPSLLLPTRMLTYNEIKGVVNDYVRVNHLVMKENKRLP
jgi:hypothetical protein